MKPIAVVLSGCGFKDGSEIHESVLTLLYLSRLGISYQALALNQAQPIVINHKSGEKTAENRNMQVEAARIARGEIKSLEDANPDDYSGAIFPGGFGAANNLSSYASEGVKGKVRDEVKKFVLQLHQLKKPLGFICIAPVLVPMIFDKPIKVTIGNDKETSNHIEALGGIPVTADSAEDCVVDDNEKIVTTPAYMLAQSIAEASIGIEKLVLQMSQWLKGDSRV